MNYPLVEVELEEGKRSWVYKADLGSAILYVHKADIDSGSTTMEDEITAFLRPRPCTGS